MKKLVQHPHNKRAQTVYSTRYARRLAADPRRYIAQ